MTDKIRITDLATQNGLDRFRGAASWGKLAREAVPQIFDGLPLHVAEMAPGLQLLFGEFADSVDLLVEEISKLATLGDDEIAEYNRAALFQSAALNLLHHAQRHIRGDLRLAIPDPDHLLIPCCTCGRGCFEDAAPTADIQ